MDCPCLYKIAQVCTVLLCYYCIGGEDGVDVCLCEVEEMRWSRNVTFCKISQRWRSLF
jgi:hypothetical protein